MTATFHPPTTENIPEINPHEIERILGTGILIAAGLLGLKHSFESHPTATLATLGAGVIAAAGLSCAMLNELNTEMRKTTPL
jgi:hypothetical protein